MNYNKTHQTTTPTAALSTSAWRYLRKCSLLSWRRTTKLWYRPKNLQPNSQLSTTAIRPRPNPGPTARPTWGNSPKPTFLSRRPSPINWSYSSPSWSLPPKNSWSPKSKPTNSQPNSSQSSLSHKTSPFQSANSSPTSTNSKPNSKNCTPNSPNPPNPP